MMLAVLLTMPGMMVRPPSTLEADIGDAHREQGAVRVGLPAKGIDLVHRDDRRQRLGAVDQQQRDDDIGQRQPQAVVAEDGREIGEHDAV